MVRVQVDTEETRDIRAELKALYLPCEWELFGKDCTEEMMKYRRRSNYLVDRLYVIEHPDHKNDRVN